MSPLFRCVGALSLAFVALSPPAATTIGAAALAGLAAWMAWHDRPAADWLWAHPMRRRVLFAALAIAATLLTTSANFAADWGPVDDHEIVRVLGGDGRLTMGEAATHMAVHHEIAGPPSPFRRYRPAYYVARFSEMVLWGDQVALWYLARAVLLATSLALTLSLLVAWLGPTRGACAALAPLTYAFQADLWTRLGPAESYALFGLALVAWSSVRLWSRPARDRLAWVALAAGALLAMGSKENFLLLVPWLLVLAWRARGTLKWAGGLALVVTLAVALRIVWRVASMLRQDGVDVYDRSVAPASRAETLLTYVGQCMQSPAFWVLVGSAMVVAAAAWFTRELGRARALRWLAALGALWLVHAAQYVFYAGAWPTGNRYDFPGVLVPGLAGLVLAWAAGVVIRTRHGAGVARAWRSLSAAALAVLVALAPVGHLQAQAARNAAVSRAWSQGIDQMVQIGRADASRPFVLVAHDIWDYEFVHAALRYLRARGVENPIYLDPRPIAPGHNAHTTRLRAELVALATEGGLGVTAQGNLPIPEGAQRVTFSAPGDASGAIRLR